MKSAVGYITRIWSVAPDAQGVMFWIGTIYVEWSSHGSLLILNDHAITGLEYARTCLCKDFYSFYQWLIAFVTGIAHIAGKPIYTSQPS